MIATTAKVLRRTLYGLLLLLTVLAIFAAIILNQLDLDNYRHEIEQELSAALEQPVTIGLSELTFSKGIALRFQDLKIGPADALLADIPFITATLQIAPLFSQQIFLDQVEIDGPKLQFWFPVLKRPERGTGGKIISQFGIRTLSIHDAGLKIHLRRKTGVQELFNLDNLQTELRSWQPNQTTKLVISGDLRQPGKSAEFLIDLSLPTSSDPKIWRNEELFYQVSVNNLNTRSTAKYLPGVANSVDLHAAIKGVPAKGTELTAWMKNSVGRESLLTLSGLWESSPEQDAIPKLTGELLGVPLAGEFYLLRQEKQQLLAGRFGVKDIDLTQHLLKHWKIPGTDKLLTGTLEQLEIVLEKSWRVGQSMDGLPRIGAEMTIADIEWDNDHYPLIQDFSVELSLTDQKLVIHDGLLVTAQQPAFFSGQIDSLLQRPQLDLKVDLNAQLQELNEQIDHPDSWKISGLLPASLHLHGPLQQPNFLLQADFSKAELSLGALLQKHNNQTSSLRLEGLLDTEQLQLDLLEMKLPGSVITGDGYFSYDPEDKDFLLDIDPIWLAGLQPISPLLKKLNLRGVLHPTLERGKNGLKSSLQLINVGAHLNNIVGELGQANGRIDIDREGLNFTEMQASFGQSAFILNGQIDDWQHPQLDLALKSPEVRAQDLIFRNRKLRLYNLDGHLQIDNKGIKFNSVKVQLEQETEAVVTGAVDDFSAPQVTLNIEAEKANIDQVIQLFIGPDKGIKHKKKRTMRPVIITAKAKQGTIGDLPFTNAEGLIRDNFETFTIYPLRFSTGKGFCLARVEFDRTRPESVLKVSGHAEGVNATILHQNLFKERGLIDGALRGDFYLEGALSGGGFWQNALGGIHLQVDDGSLRKFNSLSKVFSLLNVSQLFAGKLPDMETEGMPFSTLTGSVRVADGTLYTEDLNIISEAMNISLVGSQNLIDKTLDYHMGIMPLRTVDKVITSIPIAGWILTGKDKALFTAHFKIEGPSDAPKVTAEPVDTLSESVFGVFKRTFSLPGKLIKDVGSLFESKPKKKQEPDK